MATSMPFSRNEGESGTVEGRGGGFFGASSSRSGIDQASGSENNNNMDMAKKRRDLIFVNMKETTRKGADVADISLPFKVKNAFGLAHFATYPMLLLLTIYVFSFYESLGCNPVIAILFVAVARSIDVIVIPYISSYSDSFKSMYGRRRPIIFAASFVYAFFLYALLSPPDNMSSTSLSTWFGVSYTGFFLSSSVLNIPLDALGPELSDSYYDRSSLYLINGLYEGLGTLVAIIIPPLIMSQILDFSAIKTMSCSSSSCFNSNGVGKSCLLNPSTEKLNEFTLFDPNNWSSNSCKVLGNVTYDNPEDLYQPNICYFSNAYNSICTASYCNCVESCISICNSYNLRIGFKCVGGAFAIWVILSIMYMVYVIKERSSIITSNSSPSIVPAIVNALRNRAFICLLPAWILDSVAFTLISSMLIYFVRYVIQPEYQTKEANGIDCNQGIPLQGHESDSWMCKSDNVLGAILLGMLFFAFFCCPLWYCVLMCFGKKSAWILKSFFELISMALFILVGPGDVYLAIILGCIGGFPVAAKFLSDAMLPDIIDYDELLSGQRNEASYTMFNSLIPKIIAIPAASIPVAILNSLGHKLPTNGQIHRQSSKVYHYCWIVAVLIPSILCSISFIIKTRFPLKNVTQVDYIIKGICLHKRGLPALDPLSKRLLICVNYSVQEKQLANLLDHFPGVEDIESFRTCLKNEKMDIMIFILFSRFRNKIALTILVVVGIVIGITYSIHEFSSNVLFILPTIYVISLGISVLVLTLQISQLLAVRKLKFVLANEFTEEFIDKVVEFRQNIAAINNVAKYKIVPTPTEVYHWLLRKTHTFFNKFEQLFQTDVIPVDDSGNDNNNSNNNNSSDNHHHRRRRNNLKGDNNKQRGSMLDVIDDSSDDSGEDEEYENYETVKDFAFYNSNESMFFNDGSNNGIDELASKQKLKDDENLIKELDKLITQTNLEDFLDEQGALGENEQLVGRGIIIKKLTKYEEFYKTYQFKIKNAILKSQQELNYILDNINLMHSTEALQVHFEIHNIGIFADAIVDDKNKLRRKNSTASYLELTVWDHELSAFIMEMVVINQHFRDAEKASESYFKSFKPNQRRRNWQNEYSELKRKEEEDEVKWSTSGEVKSQATMNLIMFSPDYNENLDDTEVEGYYH